MHRKLYQLIILVLISIILTPQTSLAFSASMSIPESSTVVELGKAANFIVDIKYPENTKRKDLRLRYQVVQNGKIISESSALKAIETQIQFVDQIVIPKTANKGAVEIIVTISDYKKLSHVISSTVYTDTQAKHGFNFGASGALLSMIALFLLLQTYMITRKIDAGIQIRATNALAYSRVR